MKGRLGRPLSEVSEFWRAAPKAAVLWAGEEFGYPPSPRGGSLEPQRQHVVSLEGGRRNQVAWFASELNVHLAPIASGTHLIAESIAVHVQDVETPAGLPWWNCHC